MELRRTVELTVSSSADQDRNRAPAHRVDAARTAADAAAVAVRVAVLFLPR